MASRSPAGCANAIPAWPAVTSALTVLSKIGLDLSRFAKRSSSTGHAKVTQVHHGGNVLRTKRAACSFIREGL
jgi:hypothetical protein